MKILKSDTWTGHGETIGQAAIEAHEAAEEFLLNMVPENWRSTSTAATVVIETDEETGQEIEQVSFALTITWLEDAGDD